MNNQKIIQLYLSFQNTRDKLPLSVLNRHSMMILVLVTVMMVMMAGAGAQDTYSCPDGWDKQEDSDACR